MLLLRTWRLQIILILCLTQLLVHWSIFEWVTVFFLVCKLYFLTHDDKRYVWWSISIRQLDACERCAREKRKRIETKKGFSRNSICTTNWWGEISILHTAESNDAKVSLPKSTAPHSRYMIFHFPLVTIPISLSYISAWHIYLCSLSCGTLLHRANRQMFAINNTERKKESFFCRCAFASSFSNLRVMKVLQKHSQRSEFIEGKCAKISLSMHHFSWCIVKMCVFIKRYFNKNEHNLLSVLFSLRRYPPLTRKYVKPTNNWQCCVVCGTVNTTDMTRLLIFSYLVERV